MAFEIFYLVVIILFVVCALLTIYLKSRDYSLFFFGAVCGLLPVLLLAVLMVRMPDTVKIHPNHQPPDAVQEHHPFSDGTDNPISRKFDFKGLEDRKIEI